MGAGQTLDEKMELSKTNSLIQMSPRVSSSRWNLGFSVIISDAANPRLQGCGVEDCKLDVREGHILQNITPFRFLSFIVNFNRQSVYCTELYCTTSIVL